MVYIQLRRAKDFEARSQQSFEPTLGVTPDEGDNGGSDAGAGVKDDFEFDFGKTQKNE